MCTITSTIKNTEYTKYWQTCRKWKLSYTTGRNVKLHNHFGTLEVKSYFMWFFEKPEVTAPNLGCRGAESPGWFDVSPKNSAWDVMHEQTRCRDEASSYQLSIALAFWIIQIVSMEVNTKFDAYSLVYLLSHFEWDSHTVHMLTQWGL